MQVSYACMFIAKITTWKTIKTVNFTKGTHKVDKKKISTKYTTNMCP